MITEVRVISDTHFNDSKLLKHKMRSHSNVHDMNEALINCWNMKVKPDDIVIHLGDLALDCPESLLKEIVGRLNGIKILVKGNWDNLDNKKYLDMGFKKVYDKPIQIGNYIMSHEPISNVFLTRNPNFENFHGHSHRYTYGRQYKNFNVDVSGYKPKRVNLWDVKRESLI